MTEVALQINPRAPAEIRMLRKFALLLSVLFLGFFSVVPLFSAKKVHLWPIYLAAFLVSIAVVQPAWIRPFYVGWTKFGDILGAINSRIILGLFFVLFFTPVAIFRRITGYDPLFLKTDPKVKTFEVERKKPISKDSMEKTF